ncbi:GlcNAc-transferase family protein [Cupriavidus sp.]|uniref:GlcNAc-transferase family protein n=1 Tax=Cupriavidus sp. TaxID=1873897 RepID=UPI0028BD1BCD|nr:GlcNAc-transferase family protein [Cupriavidus sp.]
MAERIFVQMASYRDPQLIPTLHSLVRQASRPDRLRVVVCWQHGLDEMIGMFFAHGFSHWQVVMRAGRTVHRLVLAEATVELIDVPAMESQGACWARNLIQQQYAGEDYTLQIDSHHRFVHGWDGMAIEMLESLRDESARPVLTAYLPAFEPRGEDPSCRGEHPTFLIFDRFIAAGALLVASRRIPGWEALEKPLRARFYSGHFAFADGHFATNVQHDPEYFFHGEEISIAVRAFTHGYDLYHPHRVLAWHEYTRDYRAKVWDDHTPENRARGLVKMVWFERDRLSQERNRALLGVDDVSAAGVDFGPYGLGQVRTLAEYETYAGVSFARRAATPEALRGDLPTAGTDHPETALARLRRSHDVAVELYLGDLDSLSGVSHIAFTVLAADGGTLHEELQPANGMTRILAEHNGWLCRRLIFQCGADDIPIRFIARFVNVDDVTVHELARDVPPYGTPTSP